MKMKMYNEPRNHPSIDSAFSGYKPFDKFRELRFANGHISDRAYRRTAFYMLFNRSRYKCVFDTRLDILTHMLSLSATQSDLLTYKKAYEFAIKYACSQVKENESVWTMDRFCYEYNCDMAITQIRLAYGSEISCFNEKTERTEFPYVTFGAYGCLNSDSEITELSKNKKCQEYLTMTFGEVCVEAARTRIGVIKLYIDDLLLGMFADHYSFTKDTIMFNIDFTIGHERRHKEIDVPGGSWNYIANHWKASFNLTKCNAIEQECNRAGLIYAIKQKHLRNNRYANITGPCRHDT